MLMLHSYKYLTDGVNLTVGGRIRITQQQLLIGRAELTDSGLYKCNAVNIKGTVAAEATLTVVGKWKRFVDSNVAPVM